MMIDNDFKPVLQKDWGKMRENYAPLPDFKHATEMSDNDFYVWANTNGLFTGDVDLKMFRKVAGKFLDSNILNKCHLISSQKLNIHPSIVVVGSAAYKTLSLQKDTYGWIYDMTGLNRMGKEENEVRDLDIWIPRKTKTELEKSGLVFRETRTSSEVMIAEVNENGVKIQIHSLKNSDMNPLIASSFLASTDLLATSIVFDGPDVYFADPFSSLGKGPWEQQFPYRIFDPENYLMKNQPRRAVAVMIWALTTPFFPDDLSGEKEIRETVSAIIKDMDPKAISSICKKYLEYISKEPFADEFFEESTSLKVAKLAKVGVLPQLLEKTEGLESKEIKSGRIALLDSIGIYITTQHFLKTEISKKLPELTDEEHDNAVIENDYSRLAEVASKIDWQIIIDEKLPNPFN